MVRQLRREGRRVGRKRVQRLMRIMGLQAICPGPSTSKAHPEHKVYPYLLRNLPITRVDHVWSTDITYIPLQDGHVYLCAVIDWHSRYVISWSVSCSMDGPWFRSVLQEALMQRRPEVFNTDQGSQFTSPNYVKELISREIKISMDGRGRALDNVFVERLWRTVKYENVYFKGYEDMKQLKAGLKEYFEFYNYKRPHSSLDGSTPAEVYFTAEKDKEAA
jgi:putative transposase